MPDLEKLRTIFASYQPTEHDRIMPHVKIAAAAAFLRRASRSGCAEAAHNGAEAPGKLSEKDFRAYDTTNLSKTS